MYHKQKFYLCLRYAYDTFEKGGGDIPLTPIYQRVTVLL